jgi:hypothetical protein
MQAEGMFTNETFSYSVFRKQGLHEVEDILFHIGSIVDTLVISTRNAFPQNFLRPWNFGWQIILTPCAQHKTDMVVNGWCPFMVNILYGVNV